MRRKVKTRSPVEPDFIYNSQKLEKFINYVMWSGKKETARKVVYHAFDVIKEKTGNPNPLEVFDLAIKNAGSKTEGAAIKKKEDTHKMAEANKAFAHFAW